MVKNNLLIYHKYKKRRNINRPNHVFNVVLSERSKRGLDWSGSGYGWKLLFLPIKTPADPQRRFEGRTNQLSRAEDAAEACVEV